jgi:pimeloyl-ACP methyl ester carboxylesterase
MKYALAYPDRTASLVLVSPMPPSAELWQEEEALLASASQPEDTAGMGAVRASSAFAGGAPETVERLLQLSFRAQLADPRLADSLRFHIAPDYRARSRQFGYLLPDLLGYDLTPALPGLGVPTLVVLGAEEPGAALSADTLRALMPSAQLEILAGAGHFAFLEQPAAFLTLVRAFLDGCCG